MEIARYLLHGDLAHHSMLKVVIRNEVISLIPKAKRDVVLLRSESGRHHLDHHADTLRVSMWS
jgi:hypothetical protein